MDKLKEDAQTRLIDIMEGNKRRQTKYYQSNKERINKKRREKRINDDGLSCECGGKYRIYTKNKHLNTIKHINFIQTKKEQ